MNNNLQLFFLLLWVQNLFDYLIFSKIVKYKRVLKNLIYWYPCSSELLVYVKHWICKNFDCFIAILKQLTYSCLVSWRHKHDDLRDVRWLSDNSSHANAWMGYVESRNPSATVAAIRESSLVKNALTTVPVLALRIIIALHYSHALSSFVKVKSLC